MIENNLSSTDTVPEGPPVGITGSTLTLRITGSTLRDGSNAVARRFTEEQVRSVVRALHAADVPVSEVAHGDGLGRSSFTDGFSLAADKRTSSSRSSLNCRTPAKPKPVGQGAP